MLVYHVLFLVPFVGTTGLFTWLAVGNVRYGERAVDRERDWVDGRLDLDDPERWITVR